MANSAFIAGQPLEAGGFGTAAASEAIALSLLGADPDRGAGKSREKSECEEGGRQRRGRRWSRNEVGGFRHAKDWGAGGFYRIAGAPPLRGRRRSAGGRSDGKRAEAPSGLCPRFDSWLWQVFGYRAFGLLEF